MKLIAITGSVATGKSFVLDLFKEFGVPTFNCDEELRKIMKNDEGVIEQVKRKFPDAFVKNVSSVSSRRKPGSSTLGQHALDPGFRRDDTLVNREILADIIFSDALRREELEEILYPKLNIKRDEFIKNHASAAMVAIEVPLLYEKNLEGSYDVVIVTTAPKHIQEQRAKDRGITQKRLKAILSNQLADAVKVIRADYIVDTELDRIWIKEQLRSIISDIHSCNQK